MKNLSQQKLVIIVSVLFTTLYNQSFFKNVINVYSLESKNILYILSLSLLITCLTITFVSIFSFKHTTKPFLILLLTLSAFTAYFMDTYHVIIDDKMIRNAFLSDNRESLDLLSLKLFLYLIILGFVPSIFIYHTKIEYLSLKNELLKTFKLIIFCFVAIVFLLFSSNKFYTSFFREHKLLRFYANPIYWVYSTMYYFKNVDKNVSLSLKDIALDAKQIKSKSSKKKLTIMIVGETARADRFSLNGYTRDTNPLLKEQNIQNFSNFYACGTSTAESVPCMFSIYNKDQYTYNKGRTTKNVLDILKSTQNISVLWRDNNSDSKGVALRVDYEDFRTSKNNSVCDIECRDEGMLVGLDQYIDQQKNKDVLILLHQLGNHGPAYYKRYTKDFEKFTPVCKTNQLEECSLEEINNAYDNAILYTDYFISKSIDFLKNYSKEYDTTMIYVSDHGESLGENGMYLHGLPYFMAPKSQIHVPAMIWSSQELGDLSQNKKYSHDNIFHTLLGLYEVKTSVYDPGLDIFYQ